MQAQLQELESKILAHVAEMQGKSAREAVASLGLKLQKEGVVGVTEEVRNCASRTPISTHTHTISPIPGSHRPAVPHCQLPGMIQDPGDMQKPPMFALGLEWEGG